MNRDYFRGTGKLLKLYLKRDRVILPIWIILPALLMLTNMSFMKGVDDWRKLLSELSASPLPAALLGKITPLSPSGAVLWKGALQASLVLMVGNALTMLHHTRGDEESGYSELMAGFSVGKYTSLTAAMLLTAFGSILSGGIAAITMILNGMEGKGSLLTGLTLMSSGFLFAAIGAFLAQLFEQAAKARIVVFGLCAATLLPMVANNLLGGDTRWIWLAPEAWYRLVKPFDENRMWPFLLFAALIVVLIIVSYSLFRIRDLGSGLFAMQLGREHASPFLRSPLALAIRRTKGVVIAMVTVAIVLGLSMGLIIPTISDSISMMLTELSSWAAVMSKIGNQEGFLAIILYIAGVLFTVPFLGISIVLMMKKDETEHYADMILSKPVSRLQWIGSYIICALAGSMITLFSLGTAAGLGWGISMGNIGYFFKALLMSVSKIPAGFTILAVFILVFGWLPRFSVGICSGIYGLFIVTELSWEMGIAPWSVMQLTPLAYAHYSIPVMEVSIIPQIVLLIISLVLVYIGYVGLKIRDCIM